MDLDLLKLLDRDGLKFPSTKLPRGIERVVVTGAGGSIGSAIVKSLLGEVEFIGLIGHSEDPIFRLTQGISSDLKGSHIDTKIVSVGDTPEVWIEEWEPDLIR